jgi:hypothetical protein
LGQVNSVPYSEVSSFQRAICTENRSLGTRRGVLISQDVLISQGCYSQVSLYLLLPLCGVLIVDWDLDARLKDVWLADLVIEAVAGYIVLMLSLVSVC